MVANIIERRLNNQHALWIKPRRQRLQVDQASDQQPGAGQQHNRQSNLARNECLPDAYASGSHPAAVGHRRAQIHLANLKRRKHAKEHAGQNRDSEREGHHVPIQGYPPDREKVFGQQQKQFVKGEIADTNAHCAT